MAGDMYSFYVTVSNGKVNVRSTVTGGIKCSPPFSERVVSAREIDADSYIVECVKHTYLMRRGGHNSWNFTIVRTTSN